MSEITPSVVAGKLEIKARKGSENAPRLTYHDVDVTLNGVPIPAPWYKLTIGLDGKGCVRCELGFYPTIVDVDIQVLAKLGMLTTEGKPNLENALAAWKPVEPLK